MIKAVLFDMDGLMFDTESLATEAWISVAKKQDLVMTVEETLYVLGYTKESIYKFFKEYYKENDNVDSEKLVNDHYEYLENVLFTTGPKKMPYIEELLKYLRENNYKIAVASSSDISHIENNLEKTNLRHYIDKIASGEEVKNGKPAPDVFLLAAERLGVLPSECLVLEDSKYGIMAGCSAGMKAVMVPDMYKVDDEVRSQAYKIVDNLWEVVRVLEKENA